ncbi:MAG: prepilin peptidase [Candidatus Marinimicrobia bacterium]|nr:prepilin peptidase [Candidatus Neomarinimicrobiota bacterium]
MPTNGLLILPFIFGLIIGSFLNVLIYRLPRDISIIKPGSHCPKCKTQIPFYRNIPLFSYIFQLGKCIVCKENISIRYPLVELVTGCIWLFAFTNYPMSNAIIFASFVSTLVAISFIDAEFMIIPISLLFVGLLVLILNYFINEVSVLKSLYGALFGFAYLGSMILITRLIFKKQTMGYGDLLLIIILGAWVGQVDIFVTILLSAIIGLLVWTIFGVVNGFQRELALPFAPFLSVSAVIVRVFNIDIMNFI